MKIEEGYGHNEHAIKTAALKVPILPHTSPAAPQPPNLLLPLHPHQLRALHRCLLIESDGTLSGNFGDRYDYKSRGGVLADAVGMGKTATSVGMILAAVERDGEVGDTLVVAPGHLIPQWKEEIHKFTNDIEVYVGKKEYLKVIKMALPLEKKHRVVLVDVNDILNEKKLWYNFRRVYTSPEGSQVGTTREEMEQYKKAAIFCVQSPRGPCSYDGWVYTSELHIPKHPWRRVIFDEIQDLVAEGTESQKNLLQLSRTAKNVWLLSATPFPHGNKSVYANHELLGFCRLRMDVEVDHPLPSHHTFEVIKRKLYIRSPRHVADEAVTATQMVTRQVVHVDATDLEKKFHQLERNDINHSDRGNLFGEAYASLRQMMVHPEASEKLREQVHGTKEKNSNGSNSKKKKAIMRHRSVSSFAKSSLIQGQHRLTTITRVELPKANADLIATRSSLNLALKIRQIRQAPRQTNPFGTDANTGKSSLEIDEANAIHEYFCRCKSLGSTGCKADKAAKFRILSPGPYQPEFICGKNATDRIITYFEIELNPNRKVTTFGGSDAPALEHYIVATDIRCKNRVEAIMNLNAEKNTLEQRVRALSATVASTLQSDANGEEEDALAVTHGSKTAALLRHLEKVKENGERAIVFSYWHDTLRLVWRSLRRCKLSSSFCNGSSREMSNAINEFTIGNVSVLLLSAQAKASGANLQCATHVILLDPAGSSAEHGAALEQQAIGRAVRMGQEKPVTVTRFCVKDSIEEGLFREIDVAAEKLEKRSNDSSYVCENAHKSLEEVPLPQKEENEIVFTDSISATERVARIIASAKEQGDVIEILDSDDEEEEKELGRAPSSGKPLVTDGAAQSISPKTIVKEEMGSIAKNGSSANESEGKTACVQDSADAQLARKDVAKRRAPEIIGLPEKRSKHADSSKSLDTAGTEAGGASGRQADANDSLEEDKYMNSDLIARVADMNKGNSKPDEIMLKVVVNGKQVTAEADSPQGKTSMEIESTITIGSIEEFNPESNAATVVKDLQESESSTNRKVKPILSTRDKKWLKSLANLVRYKEENGDCNVPKRWDSALAVWVNNQRSQYRQRQQNKYSPITNERIRQLEAIGFDWNSSFRPSTGQKKEMGSENGQSTKIPNCGTGTSTGGTGIGRTNPSRKRVAPEGDVVMQRRLITNDETQLKHPGTPTSPGSNTAIPNRNAGIFVSPDLDRAAKQALGKDTVNLCSFDEVEKFLVDVKLEAYSSNFRDRGYTSLKQFKENMNNAEYMEKLVTDVGFTAGHAVRFQILINRSD